MGENQKSYMGGFKEDICYAKRTTPVECKDDQSGRRKKEAKKQTEGQTTGIKTPQLCREMQRRIESCVYKVYAKRSKRLDSIIKHILFTKLSDE